MSERGRLITRGEAAEICKIVHARGGDALSCVAWPEDGYTPAQVAVALGESGVLERTLPRRAGVESLDPGTIPAGERERREREAQNRQAMGQTRYGRMVREQ